MSNISHSCAKRESFLPRLDWPVGPHLLPAVLPALDIVAVEAVAADDLDGAYRRGVRRVAGNEQGRLRLNAVKDGPQVVKVGLVLGVVQKMAFFPISALGFSQNRYSDAL